MRKSIVVAVLVFVVGSVSIAQDMTVSKVDGDNAPYIFTTYKTVKDINGNSVTIVDKTETIKKADLERQINNLQSQLNLLNIKLQKIEDLN